MLRRELFILPFALQAQSPIALTGLADLPPAPLELNAGPLSLLFEPGLGFARYIRFGEHEVLRGIYAAVRDKSWGTVAPKVTNLKTTTSPSGFQLDFDVACQEREIDFAWHGTITGETVGATATLRFDFAGEARSSFERNRVGFCVLHPLAECAGQPCRAEQADGKVVTGQFPALIAPNQPLLNLRALSHRLPDGSDVEVRFAGDIFEMEDHRNWTDGNYKTYCTPLAIPYPVLLAKGTRVEQSVTVKVTPRGTPAKPRSRAVVELTMGPDRAKLPSIGFGLAAAEQPLGARETAMLTGLKPAHLRVDLRCDLPSSNWRALLARAITEARGVNAGLEVALILSDAAEADLKAVVQAMGAVKPVRWLVFRAGETATNPVTLALARRYLLGPLTSGTNQYFTELNRERPDLAALDAVCYSLNPQVHAFDNASLVENLAPQGDTVRSARQFCGTKPLVITPVTLRPRFNPQQRGPEPPTPPGKLPSRIDHRQPTLFGAAWTLGSLKYLSEAGAASITYYETHGWGGVLMPGASPLPEVFHATPGMVFPLFHVFADVAEFAGGSGQALLTESPLEVIGWQLALGARRRTLVANLTARPRIVRVPAAKQVAIRTLDDRSFLMATTQPDRFRRPSRTVTTTEATIELPLGPYAVATLDLA
ncbi:MAG: hypothetical protein K2X03_21910 [Bryobacteraceae bacterium]|nr:hypothetical protein [Bryobacteraceae bacterium]